MRDLHHRRRRKPLVKILVWLALLCLLLGWGLAHLVSGPQFLLAAAAQPTDPAPASMGTVDVVPPRYQLGQQLYLESCGSCHIALPPQVLPTQTWQELLQDPNHYGAQLQLPMNPQLQYIWGYLQLFSRPLKSGEAVPYRVAKSQYFKVLHPKVAVPQSLSSNSCVSCHPGAADYNFRSLTRQWQDAP